MTTRRTILGAAVAAPILSGALPALAQEPLAARVLRHKAILLENVRRIVSDTKFSRPSIPTSSTTRVLLKLNERLIDRHPDLFIHQPMMGPVGLVGEKIILAKTRKMKARYTFELAYDGIPPAGAEDELIDYLVDEFAAELRLQDSPIHFYTPVLSSGAVIDPITLEPAMTFMTRYG